MSDAVELTGDEAALANRITAIDAELDALEQRTQDVLGFGLHGSAIGGWAAHQAEDRLDARHAALMAERDELTARLRREVEGS